MLLIDLYQESGLESTGKIHVSPKIPAKILNNALDSFKYTGPFQNVAALIDETRMGSGKDGSLICEDEIIIKKAFSKPVVYETKKISSINLKKNILYINEIEIYQLNKKNEEESDKLFKILDLWIKKYNSLKPNDLELEVLDNIISNEEIEQINEKDGIKESENEKKSNRLVGVIATIIESNKSSILPFLKDKTGDISISFLQNDEAISLVASKIYVLLPAPIRFLLREDAFIQFALNNKEKILGKLIEDGFTKELTETEQEVPQSLEAPAPKVVEASP